MAKHKQVPALQIPESVFTDTRHFFDHGALQMNHLIMRENKNKLLTCGITHAKGHLIVIVLTEIRIQFHIIEEIMHPTHIPFICKSKPIVLRSLCDLRPCRRFFRNDNRAVFSATDHRIQMFEELNRIQIPIAAEFIRYPFTIFAAIVKIQHGRNRIDT